MILLHDMTLQELTDYLVKEGYPSYRARQLYAHLTKYDAPTNAEMTDLPTALIDKLAKDCIFLPVKERECVKSKDDSCKFLFELYDGNLIESVYMPHKYGVSVCLSTQVGCAMGCVFCASGADGLVRSLSCGEILAQALYINKVFSKGGRAIDSVVLMGSGSPLANYENTLKFIRLCNDKDGLNLSMRSISLSTCGIPDKIRRLADDGFSGTLSLSLHSAIDEKRKQIMKIANVYSLDTVIDAVRYFFQKTKRRVIYEYAMIKGFNDSDTDAKALASLTRGMSCHVNLIRLNPVDNCDLRPTDTARVNEFIKLLEGMGVSVTLRHSMGSDVAGACGQLKNRTVKNNAKKP